MRIDKLTIGNFKNLRDFSIDFDEKSLTTVLVGQNGTGKSNLLEALVLIFRDLDLGAPPPFCYQIVYLCRGHKIEIDADPTRPKASISIKVNGANLPYSRFVKAPERPYLPNYVFGYYSGPSNRLESHFEKHQKKFSDALLAGNDRALRPMFYARPVHSQFVLLAFFTKDVHETAAFLKEHLGIEGFESVLFVMKEPPWSGSSKEGDPRFWHARGVVRQFLGRLYKLALAPMRIPLRVTTGLGKTTTLEHLFLFIPDAQRLRGLASAYPSQQDFFKTLESTYISDLVKEVRIRVRVRHMDGTLTFRELSEGEQQLLTVLGLLRFTKEQESLFLLDEPDTHLNPAWSQEYLDLLNKVVGWQETSHIILATHDPLVVAGLQKSQVKIMQRDAETGRISARIPDEDPKGMGVSAILTSELFGLRSALDLETLGMLDEKRRLAIKEDLTAQERERLRELNEKLESIDFTQAVRDPLYGKFVEAMTRLERREQPQKPVVTPGEIERQRELALEVVQSLQEERQEGA